MLGVSFNLVNHGSCVHKSQNIPRLQKAELSGWYFDSKTSVCSSSSRKYEAMASKFLALFVFEKYFPLIFQKCGKIFSEGITRPKRRSSAILERTRAMKFTVKSLRAVCSTKRGQLATACFTIYRNSKFQLMLSGVIMPNTSQFDLVCCKCRLIVFSFQFIRNKMYLYTRKNCFL